MPSLVVIEAGVSSIQGLGRYGSQRYGIAPGGAMDRLSLAESNALTGQPAGAAAIEVGSCPARFRVAGGPIRIALAGADRDIYIADRAVQPGVTHLVDDGELITLRGARDGQYTYLSIQGGLLGRCNGQLQAPALETSVESNRNSWVFQDSDCVALLSAVAGQPERQLRLQRRGGLPVRIVLGPQLEYFSNQAVNSFLSGSWKVSHASNRMAYVLEGDRVEFLDGFDIVSDGTVTGNIQVSGSGQPIAILRDRGTIGGYPKIATIISADIGRFSQTPVGREISFEAVSVMEAQVVARHFAFELANIKAKVELMRQPGPPSVKALLSNNVAGDVYNALEWRVG
jgi:5-oxoprolinase (ATP-hydrolysing) subunit C